MLFEDDSDNKMQDGGIDDVTPVKDTLDDESEDGNDEGQI
jgi:hypothetical protein